MGMNGLLALDDRAWILRATTSLPVPDSPKTKTLASVSDTCSISLRTLRMPALLPTRLRNKGFF